MAFASPASADHYDHMLPPAGECADESDTAAPRGYQRAAMRCLANRVRIAAGIAELSEDTALWWSAIDKAYDIRDCQDFSHEACGLPTDYWIGVERYLDVCDAWGTGENIYWGSGDLGTARAAMSAWLHSDGHRENLLDPGFRDQGVGLAQGPFLGYDDAQMWVHPLGYCLS